MWIVDDETMVKLLGGDYTTIIETKKKYPHLTVRELFCIQFYYNSYDGFRKFYNKSIRPIIDGIKFVNNQSLSGKIVKLLVGGKNEDRQ